MKIIIEHGNTKREINGSFNICGHPDDVRSIALQLLSHLDEHQPQGYGWHRIYSDVQRTIANTSPVPWD